MNEGTAIANIPGQAPPTPGSVSVITGFGSQQKVTATIAAGLGYPTSATVDPFTHDVYVADSTSVAVIDGSSDANHDKVIATIDSGRRPEAMAVDPSTHDLYVVDGGSGTMSVFHTVRDPLRDKLVATIPIGQDPGPIAVDLATHAVYVTTTQTEVVTIPYTTVTTVSVIDGSDDADHDQVIGSVPVGDGGSALAVDPSDHYVYVAGQHTVSVIDPSNNGRHDTVVATIGGLSAVAVTALAIDPFNHVIYAADLEGRLSVIDGATDPHKNEVVGGIPFGCCLQALAFDPSTRDVYVAVFSFDTIRDVLEVIREPEADVALTITGSQAAADGSKFTEKVTVTNGGPDTAPSVSTDLRIPAGLSVCSSPGATAGPVSNSLEWTDTALAPGARIAHLVTLSVAVHAHVVVTLRGTAIGSVDDPDPTNNTTAATIHLG